VKSNPQAAKGLLVEGVLRDGDWNIAQKWEGDNGIKNNPDEKTWDPDAVNWINASDYNVAAADYVAGKCDDRKVVKRRTPHRRDQTRLRQCGRDLDARRRDYRQRQGRPGQGGQLQAVSLADAGRDSGP
jgi:hypothetical protein